MPTPSWSVNGPSGERDRPVYTLYPVTGPEQQLADDPMR